jgi:hypothetical protein
VSTTTRTWTTTFTHTATHLAGTITASLTELLLHLGVHHTTVTAVASYECAFAVWITERSLGSIVVEIADRYGNHRKTLEFAVDYPEWQSEARFADGLPRIRREMSKLSLLPSGCTFTVTARPRHGYRLSDQAGWGTRYKPFAPTTDTYNFGTVGRGPGAAAVLRVST